MTESEIAITVRNLGKRYRVYDSPRDKLKEILLFGRRVYHRPFWALKDISFQMRKGQTLGIVGRNGAGKSTLLQILCGTVYPSEGVAEIRGRVSALLELGTGFNPEFTGKENVYMNASILGLSRDEIDERYEEIVDFADIGDFMDQPVKTYSSGMYVRLAFSVAINVKPEILVVDEALAVGDELFQRKCFARLDDLKTSGCTILFVSHNPAAIIELCDQALLLDQGECISIGAPKEVVTDYHKLANSPHGKRAELRERIRSTDGLQVEIDTPNECEPPEAASVNESRAHSYFDPNLVNRTPSRYGEQGAEIMDPRLTTPDGVRVNCLIRGEYYDYSYKVKFHKTRLSVLCGMVIKTPSGIEIGGCVTHRHESGRPVDPIPVVPANSVLRARFRFCCMLLPGAYFLDCGLSGVADGTFLALDRWVDATPFRVQGVGPEHAYGIVYFKIEPSFSVEPRQAHEL